MKTRGTSPAARRLYLRAALIGLVGVLVYLSSLRNGFVSDDFQLILRHPFTRRVVDWPRIFTAGHYAGGGGYRPITTLTFAINYLLGRTEPFGYHLVNILLHGLVTALVYLLFWRLLHSASIAFAGALVFAIHPIHTEAVAWISGRAELLAALFFLCAWLSFERATRRAPFQWRTLAVSFALFFGALLSKENALVLPLALVIGDIFFARRESNNVASAGVVPFLKQRWPIYAGYLGVIGFYCGFRGLLYHQSLLRIPSQIAFVDNPLARVPLLTRLFTALRVQGEYLWLMLWPRKLCGDYSYDAVPVASSGTPDAITLISIAVLLALLAVAIFSYVRRGKVWFGIVFYFLALAPVSNIPVIIGTIKAERLLYLPSIGFCLIAGIAWRSFRHLIARRTPRPAMEAFSYAALTLVLVADGLKTWRRNQIWRNDFTFWTNTALASPRNFKAQFQFGYLALMHKDLAGAIGALQHAHEIDPNSPDAVMNLGVALMQASRNDEALRLFQNATMRQPQRAAFHENLALAEARLGQNADAITEMRRAIKLDPGKATYHFNLALLFTQTRDLESAIPEFRATIECKPDHAEAWSALGVTLSQTGRRVEARAALLKALQLRPRYPEAVAKMKELEASP